MNAFQIRNKDNKPISMSDLDEEVAKFWDREVQPKQYAQPTDYPLVGRNWFDTIGKAIAEKGRDFVWGNEPWDKVKDCLFLMWTLGLSEHDLEEQIKQIKEVNKMIQPYYELIDHWEEKGYVPITIVE